MLTDCVIQAIVSTAQPEKAKAFYGETLGLKLLSEDQFALMFVGKIGILRVAKAPGVVPSTGAVLGFMVPDVPGAAAALTAKGVRIERYAFLTQDEQGVWTAPDGTKVCWFRDPDLNLLSLISAPA